jgi:multidrug efflux pump subunit AcrA (membrane-fusion protein)
VFVERSTGVFEPRSVQIGWRSGDLVEIVHGLAEGERVVVEGTFLVDSESRMKSRSPQLNDKNAQPKNSSKVTASVTTG